MLKTIFRSVLKTKSLLFVQAFGFAIAIAAATILFLTAMFELSFDNFHQNKSSIGLLYLEEGSHSGNGEAFRTAMPAPLFASLSPEIPEIQYASRYLNSTISIRNLDNEISLNNKYVDSTFLSIFNFELIAGNTKALDDINGLIIDENTSTRLFGHERNVVGRTVQVNLSGIWENKIITAVAKNTPKNSSITFNSLMRFENSPNFQNLKNDWSSNYHSLFIKIKGEKIDDVTFSKITQSFTNQYYKDEIVKLKNSGIKPGGDGNYISMHLLPLGELHLSNLDNGSKEASKFPWILLSIAGLILFISGSNFVNLSLANSIKRTKEICTRKTIGGTTGQLFFQFWMESVVVCMIGLALGLLIASVLLPQYNAIIGYQLKILDLIRPLSITIFFSVFLLLTLITGGYPALQMARVNIIENIRSKGSPKTSRLQNSLTVLQFAIAILLCISTLIISFQLKHLYSKPLGFNKTEVISIPIGSLPNKQQSIELMRAELSKYSWVEGVSGSDINIGQGTDGTTSTSKIGFAQEGKEITTNYLLVDYDILNTLQVELIAGRDFSLSHKTDDNAVIINESMAEQLGGIDAILNKTLKLGGEPQVIGVAKNFNFQDLRQSVGPLTMRVSPDKQEINYIFVRINTNNLQTALQDVESIWKQVNPKATHTASFLDSNTQNQYKNDQKVSTIVLSGAVVAIVIAILGLFALTVLQINSKIKEIGIRRVLGSSISNIVFPLSKNFIKLMLLAFLIASPLAWLIMNKWLEQFAYRIQVLWWMILLAGAFMFLLAILTIIGQAIKAARLNPVVSLKED